MNPISINPFYLSIAHWAIFQALGTIKGAKVYAGLLTILGIVAAGKELGPIGAVGEVAAILTPGQGVAQ